MERPRSEAKLLERRGNCGIVLEFYLLLIKGTALLDIPIDKPGCALMNVYRPEERRLVLRLMAYWDDLRGDRSYPTMTEVDPAAIGNDWPFCCLLALRTPLSHSTFEYLGDALLGADGQTRAPRKLGDTAEHALVYHALGYLDRMLEKGVPVSLGNEAQLDEGPALYRSILLPLSEDGRRIDHVLAAANYRWVAVADSAGEALSDAGGAPA